MTVIDAHVHLYPPEISADPAGWAQAHGESTWGRMSVRTRKSGVPVQGFPSEKALLASMDQAGIERSVLLGWYWDTPEACALQNRYYASLIQAHPDRFWALATVQLKGDTGAALDAVGRAMDLGFKGLGELCPQAQGYPLLGEALEAVIAACPGRPILFHADDPNGRPYPGRVATPHEAFIEIARRHPSTPFVLAHWGGLLPLLATRLVPDNLYYDTAASPLLYDPSIWRRFVEAVPAGRVLFGSDTPLTLYPNRPGSSVADLLEEVKASGISEAAMGSLLGGAAQTVLSGSLRSGSV